MKGWLDLVLSVEPNARARAFSPLNSLNSYIDPTSALILLQFYRLK